MVCDDYGGVEVDGFFGDGTGEVDGEENVVRLPPRGVEGGFEEQAGVVPGGVGKGFRVAGDG